MTKPIQCRYCAGPVSELLTNDNLNSAYGCQACGKVTFFPKPYKKDADHAW